MLENITIAHRGVWNNKNIPENSMLAFKTALKENYPIEFDIHLTKDNVLIVFHDDNLKRMTGKDINICDARYDEIKKLCLLKTKQKIPTLKEVLDLVDGKVLLDIEIKTPKVTGEKELVNKLLEDLKDYEGDILLKSFNPVIMKKIKRKTKKKYPIGLLLDYQYDNKFVNFLFKTKLPIKYLRPNFLAINKKMINPMFYYKMHRKYSILLWTITSEIQKSRYQKEYKDLGYICNNLIEK